MNKCVPKLFCFFWVQSSMPQKVKILPNLCRYILQEYQGTLTRNFCLQKLVQNILLNHCLFVKYRFLLFRLIHNLFVEQRQKNWIHSRRIFNYQYTSYISIQYILFCIFSIFNIFYYCRKNTSISRPYKRSINWFCRYYTRQLFEFCFIKS